LYHFQDVARYWPKICEFYPPNRTHIKRRPHRCMGFTVELGNSALAQNTGLMAPPGREICLMISLYTSVTDRQMDGRQSTLGPVTWRGSVEGRGAMRMHHKVFSKYYFILHFQNTSWRYFVLYFKLLFDAILLCILKILLERFCLYHCSAGC